MRARYHIKLARKDLIRQVFRAGGPGGQHQNKTESAVRYIHVPTGIVAESRSERSQHQNDENALALLKEKLIRLWLLRHKRSAAEAWQRKPDASYGAKMRSYVLVGQRRVVDHETGWSGDPDCVLNGDIDSLLRARLVARAQEQWELL